MPLYSSLPKADGAAIDTASAERRSIDDLDREICALGIELAGQPSVEGVRDATDASALRGGISVDNSALPGRATATARSDPVPPNRYT
jgi:hypothetical protein